MGIYLQDDTFICDECQASEMAGEDQVEDDDDDGNDWLTSIYGDLQ
jgi:hypothetical protein